MSSQQMTKQDYDEEIFKKVKEMYPISSEYELLRARQMAKVLTFQRDELGIAILSDGPNISATLAKQHNQELRMEVKKKQKVLASGEEHVELRKPSTRNSVEIDRFVNDSKQEKLSLQCPYCNYKTYKNVVRTAVLELKKHITDSTACLQVRLHPEEVEVDFHVTGAARLVYANLLC